MWLELMKVRREKVRDKNNMWRASGWKISKFDENYKSTGKCITNPKEKVQT